VVVVGDEEVASKKLTVTVKNLIARSKRPDINFFLVHDFRPAGWKKNASRLNFFSEIFFSRSGRFNKKFFTRKSTGSPPIVGLRLSKTAIRRTCRVLLVVRPSGTHYPKTPFLSFQQAKLRWKKGDPYSPAILAGQILIKTP
jgi:hypothetical protein